MFDSEQRRRPSRFDASPVRPTERGNQQPSPKQLQAAGSCSHSSSQVAVSTSHVWLHDSSHLSLQRSDPVQSPPHPVEQVVLQSAPVRQSISQPPLGHLFSHLEPVRHSNVQLSDSQMNVQSAPSSHWNWHDLPGGQVAVHVESFLHSNPHPSPSQASSQFSRSSQSHVLLGCGSHERVVRGTSMSPVSACRVPPSVEVSEPAASADWSGAEVSARVAPASSKSTERVSKCRLQPEAGTANSNRTDQHRTSLKAEDMGRAYHRHRLAPKWFGGVLLLLAIVIPGAATAQLMPPDDARFVPAVCDGTPAADAAGDAMGMGFRDVVGTLGSPAVLVAPTADDLFVRIRLDDTPLTMTGELVNFGWGIGFDGDGNTQTWELGVFLTSTAQGNQVALWSNDMTMPDDPADVAERQLETFTPPGDFWAATVAATTTNDTPDHFLTIRIPWANLESNGVSRDGVLFWVAGSRTAATLNGDMPCVGMAPTFSGAVLEVGQPVTPGTDMGMGGADGGSTSVDAGSTSDASDGDDTGSTCIGADCDPFADTYARGGGCSMVSTAVSWPALLALFLFGRRRRR